MGIALVTGGARRIERAIAEQLSADGHVVVVADILADEAAETASGPRSRMEERPQEVLARAVPLRRIGTPEDVAPAVAFLASNGAVFITGQTLSVSGGLTMA